MHAPVFTLEGKKSEKEITLSKEIFDVDFNQGLVYLLHQMQRTNARNPIAHTLTRGERRGSTRKIYKQKGTGRARMGSNRSPIRKKGGVAFGPRSTRNFEVSMNKKERRKALFGLLSEKAKDNKISVLAGFTPNKTREFAQTAHAIHPESTALYVATRDEIMVFRTGRNIPHVKVIHAHVLNPRDLMKYDHVVFTEQALGTFQEIYNASYEAR